MSAAAYVNVIFPQISQRQFTYRLPSDFQGELQSGQRVIAPLKQSPTMGFVLQCTTNPPGAIDIKPLIEIVDFHPLIPPELFSFLQRLADYYLTPLARVLNIAIPAEYRLNKSRHLFPASETPALTSYSDIYQAIATQPGLTVARLKSRFAPEYLRKGISYLKYQRAIIEQPIFQQPTTRSRVLKAIALTASAQSDCDLLSKLQRATRQVALIQMLLASGGRLEAKELKSFSPAIIKSLTTKGVVSCEYEANELGDFWSAYSQRAKQVTLTDEQQQVFLPIQAALTQNRYAAFLIEGVTGSGKTEIYIQLIRETLAQGKTALVLVPEITLTSHLAGRFKGVFGDQIAIWHSRLTVKQRKYIWEAIRQGQYPLVIGARSAILLPQPRLGLIVVDEEQDTSYKQRSPEPRYQGRDAALLRGSLTNCVVVLGSATPSLESQYNAAVGKLTRLTLSRRFAKAPQAHIHVVDMRTEQQETGDPTNPLSRLLLAKIGEKLSLKQQVLILQNRRGFSHVLLCPDCGYVARCRNCDIALTYHKKENRLICHYCNFALIPPPACPQCGSSRFLFPGVGTQKVETLLRQHFPQYALGRLDIDTSQESGYAQRLLKAFEEQQIHILLGTQMIAKGLDFPNVTLVGVVNADVGLFMPDFRARERVFQLLYQVSGRAGRGDIQGEIVIQTYNPQDFTIRCALQQNLSLFSNRELSERNPLDYPPFSRLALIQISSLQQTQAEQVAQEVAQFLNNERQKIQLLGPAPAPLAKIKNRYRYQIILKSRKDLDPAGVLLRQLLSSLLRTKHYQRWSSQARLTIDIDPIDLL